MERIVEASLKKVCPLSGDKRDMWYRYIPGRPVVQSNGCDHASGSPTCRACMEAVLKELKERL